MERVFEGTTATQRRRRTSSGTRVECRRPRTPRAGDTSYSVRLPAPGSTHRVGAVARSRRTLNTRTDRPPGASSTTTPAAGERAAGERGSVEHPDGRVSRFPTDGAGAPASSYIDRTPRRGQGSWRSEPTRAARSATRCSRAARSRTAISKLHSQAQQK